MQGLNPPRHLSPAKLLIEVIEGAEFFSPLDSYILVRASPPSIALGPYTPIEMRNIL
jgi:hypothetical protein